MTPQIAYGLRLESDMPIAGLPAPCGDEIATVRVYEDEALSAATASPHSSPDAEYDVYGHPLRLFVNGGLEVRWGDIAYYRIAVGDAQIRCAYGPGGSVVHMQQWMLHCALPLHILIERHLEFLHGGSVQIGEKAVAFLAASGVGKSTLVEHFVQRGHGFLTDDKLGVVRREGRYFSVPSTPFLSTDDAKLHWKRAPNYVRGMVPLSALYVLTPADPAAAPAVEPLHAARAPFELGCRSEVRLPERVRSRLGLARADVAGFAFACELASRVRVNQLIVPRTLARLPEVYDAVVADVEKHG
jgi:hypothetical protein